VLGAEGSKQEQELQSQGYKIQLTNESEGDLIKTTNASKAMKLKQVPARAHMQGDTADAPVFCALRAGKSRCTSARLRT